MSHHDRLEFRHPEAAKAASRTVAVIVRGGVVQDVTGVPDGYAVEIVDYDNLDAGDGTGDDSCPCRLGPDDCDVCAHRRAVG